MRSVAKVGFDGCVAVYEVTSSSQQRAREALQQLGYRVAIESTKEAIEARCLGAEAPQLLLVSLPEGRELVEAALESPRPPIIIASMSGPLVSTRQRFRSVDAELYTVRPHSTESLGPLLHAAGLLSESRTRLQTLRNNEERLKERLHEVGHSDNVTGFQHFEFFKRLLVLEIKRAKRYNYGVAVCVVARDPLVEEEVPPSALEKLHLRVARAVTTSIRDIDIPVDYSDNRMLLFLPYTDTDGAMQVGERVRAAVERSARVHAEDREISMSVSVGVAALREGHELSFSKILRSANAALESAQGQGGNSVCGDPAEAER